MMSGQRAEDEPGFPPPPRPFGPVVWIVYFTALGAVAGWAGDAVVSWRAVLVSGVVGVCACGTGALARWVRVSRATGRYSLRLLLILELFHGLLLGAAFGVFQLFPAMGVAALVQRAAGGAAVAVRVLAGAGLGALGAVVVAWGFSQQSRRPRTAPTGPAEPDAADVTMDVKARLGDDERFA
jgi:hypothetical protein